MDEDYIIKESVIDKFVHNLNVHYKSRESRQHLCNCVKPLREKYGISLNKLAMLAEIDKHTLINVENGRNTTTAQIIARIYYALYKELNKENYYGKRQYDL